MLYKLSLSEAAVCSLCTYPWHWCTDGWHCSGVHAPLWSTAWSVAFLHSALFLQWAIYSVCGFGSLWLLYVCPFSSDCSMCWIGVSIAMHLATVESSVYDCQCHHRPVILRVPFRSSTLKALHASTVIRYVATTVQSCTHAACVPCERLHALP